MAKGSPEKKIIGQIRAAIREYHLALDNRDHQGVAAGKALDSIRETLRMPWVQGKELKRLRRRNQQRDVS